ncbi:hypothetical protein [uncultured Williamsia sp.]|uniref:hypothetical protein n=1 Tax=uncultured Williamsia sp. TaxID=259311 RepID=UPI0026142764|nr:hypothetical protein [uncultured Williamsia sp.]
MQGADYAYARLEQVLGWVAWIACLIAVGRLIWLGGLFWQAKRGEHGDMGIETLVAQLAGTVLVGSAGAIAGALLS